MALLTSREPRTRSEPGLDLFRGLVVLMMIVVHARRLQAGRGSSPLERVWDAFMWMEPYIAASFLFIAGFSLVLSRARARDGWLGHLLRRSLGLYALAIVLFVPQYGIELPDLLLSPGILSAIALSLVGVGAALASTRPDLWLSVLAVAVLGVTFALDRSGATVPGLNAGPGGSFPLIAFAAAGALVARQRAARGDRVLHLLVLAAIVPFVLVLWSGQSWITTRASLYRQHTGQLALVELLSAAGPRAPISFWNHSALGSLGLLLPLSASLAALLAAGHALARPLWPLVCIGRHALSVYVVHLGLLGVADLAGLGPAEGNGTAALIAGIALAALAVSLSLDRWPLRTLLRPAES